MRTKALDTGVELASHRPAHRPAHRRRTSIMSKAWPTVPSHHNGLCFRTVFHVQGGCHRIGKTQHEAIAKLGWQAVEGLRQVVGHSVVPPLKMLKFPGGFPFLYRRIATTVLILYTRPRGSIGKFFCSRSVQTANKKWLPREPLSQNVEKPL